MRTTARRAFVPTLAAMASLFLFSARVRAAATIENTFGSVQIQKAGAQEWLAVRNPPFVVQDGDTVKTGWLSKATLAFQDGSKIELSGNSSFTLQQSRSKSFLMKLNLGSLRAFVTHLLARQFVVRTPTAVCAVRGTEFRVQVLAGGSTIVDLYKGLLAVTDHRGQQLLLHPDERTEIDMRGLRRAGLMPAGRRERLTKFHELMKEELATKAARTQMQAMAVRELRLADYQQGKSLIDAFGNRVRLEEYIVRPQPDQFKLVVLNDRKDSFNYFTYLGTFNTTLPSDLSLALRELSGTPDAPPQYYLTAFETKRSNSIDSVQEIANGGHPVDINNNGVASDAVSSYFDATKNAYVSLKSGESFYKTLFNNEGFYVDGTLKSGWSSATNITTYNGSYAGAPTLASTTDPITGASLTTALPSLTQSSTFPDADTIHQVIYDSYGDGTFIQWDNYIINDQGQVATASEFNAPTSGASFNEKILNYNYEQVITASEFNGRKIDLVVAPKVLVQSGLIQ